MHLNRIVRRPAVLATFLAVACFAAPALADTNPAYEGWAKCKPGATTVVKGTSEAGGQKTSQTITTKLLEVKPDKVVVEVSMAMEMMGQKLPANAVKQEIPKETPKPPEGVKMPEIKKGTDTVTVMGKSMNCETSEMTTEQNGMKINAKSWTCPDVPGAVKVVSSTSGAVTSTSTMELVEFKNGD